MKKSVTITRIRSASWGKLVGAIQGVCGFLAGLAITVTAAAGYDNIQNELSSTYGVATVFTLFAFIILPIIFFIGGWIQGVVTAWFLNLFLAGTGGIGLEVEDLPIAPDKAR